VGSAGLGLLAVASVILELMVALGCCCGTVVAVGLREGWEEDSGAAAVFGLRKQGADAGLVSCVSGRCCLGNQRGSRRC